VKSGKKVVVINEVKINLDDYQDAHLDEKCRGKFKLVAVRDQVLSLGDLGPHKLPVVPYIQCDSCEAAYIAPRFQEGFERFLAVEMILTPKMLTKPHIRFLRNHFGLTQQEVADKLGMSDRQHYYKMESKNFELHMGPDKQVRLKTFYAEKCGIRKAEDIYRINSIEDQPLRITREMIAEAPIFKECANL
jgi:DNA-binding XRE family transcriptional regulator